MNRVERVITALNGGIPDKVPYMYNTVMQNVQEAIVGHPITVPTYTGMNSTGWLGSYEETPEVIPALTCAPEVAEKLNLDAFSIQILPPLFVNWVQGKGEAFVKSGLIDCQETFRKCKAAMPDPDDEKLMRRLEEMIRMYKGEFALGARIRLGASPTLLSVGLENIAEFMAEEDETLEQTIEMYTDWTGRLCKNLCELDFDFFWTFDDIAFTSNMMISPSMFRNYFKEPMAAAAKNITKPLIYHSDGNYSAVLDDIIDIGANAIHPIERKSMDSRWLVENYGKKLCMVGNVDIDHILYDATEEEVDAEVKSCIDLFGPGGGYIICDSNSIPAFCSAKNIMAMANAVEKYRYIY